MTVYESRAELYLAMLRDEARTFDTISEVLQRWLAERGCDEGFVAEAARVLRLDRAFCPRVGQGGAVDFEFDFAADRAAHHLGRMELPPAECFAPQATTLRVQHPGAVGEVLLDPDGGSWMRGQVAAQADGSEGAAALA